jgi:preprotein translocase subunit SecE
LSFRDKPLQRLDKLLHWLNRTVRANQIVQTHASLVQLVERRSPKPDVEGSSPSGRAGQFGQLVTVRRQADDIYVVEACFLTEMDIGELAMATEDKAMPEGQGKKPSFDPTVFAQDTKDELKYITWPTSKQLINESFAVILMVTLSAVLIYGIDQFLHVVQKAVFK